jgi:hypothetical protein
MGSRKEQSTDKYGFIKRDTRDSCGFSTRDRERMDAHSFRGKAKLPEVQHLKKGHW